MTKFFSTESDTVNAELNPPEILFQSELRSKKKFPGWWLTYPSEKY